MTLALERAKHALEKIESLQRQGGAGNYLAYVKGLPANILRSGLGQAMAMEKAGADDPGHGHLFNHVESWLTADRANAPYRNRSGQLFRAITDGGQTQYVRAQAEALAYLEWLKKFAVAMLEPSNPDSAETAARAGSE